MLREVSDGSDRDKETEKKGKSNKGSDNNKEKEIPDI